MLQVVGGALAVVSNTASQAYLPSLVGTAHVAEAKLATSRSVARIVGPGLAGGLVQLVSAPTAILVDALSFGVSAACRASVFPSHAQPRQHGVACGSRSRRARTWCYAIPRLTHCLTPQQAWSPGWASRDGRAGGDRSAPWPSPRSGARPPGGQGRVVPLTSCAAATRRERGRGSGAEPRRGRAGTGLIFAAGGSATDRTGRLFEGLRLAGGSIDQVGVPVDPGTACWIGHLGGVPGAGPRYFRMRPSRRPSASAKSQIPRCGSRSLITTRRPIRTSQREV